MRRLDDPEVGFIASLQDQERARYYRWYRKYVFIWRATWLVGAAQVGFVIVLFRIPALGQIVKTISPYGLLLLLGLMMWRYFLECPRCGQTFQTNNRYDVGGQCCKCGLSLRQLSSIARPRG